METAYLLLRMALGLNIFMHGFTRLYSGINVFEEALLKEFKESFLPVRSLKITSRLLPPAEAIIGLCLFLGLFTPITLRAGSLIMLLLIFGKSVKAEWQTVSLQMIYVLFYTLLIAARSFNIFSLDTFFFQSK